jgi:hypothetical protein
MVLEFVWWEKFLDGLFDGYGLGYIGRIRAAVYKVCIMRAVSWKS